MPIRGPDCLPFDIFADGGYRGAKLQNPPALGKIGRCNIEVVQRALPG